MISSSFMPLNPFVWMPDSIFATDIIPSVTSPHLNEQRLPVALDLVAAKAEEIGFTGIGRYAVFIHLDMRDGKARWDERTKV